MDDDVYEWAKRYRWGVAGRNRIGVYVARSIWHRREGRRGYGTAVYLHRSVMGEPPRPGLEVDHRNGDPLDCRRENLRWVTVAQNAHNRRQGVLPRSGHRNVSWFAEKKRWRVRLVADGKSRSLGYFRDLEEAVAVAEQGRRQHQSGYVPGRAR